MDLLTQFFRGICWRGLYPFNFLLHHIETRRRDREISLPYVPVFIIGAPRSGSTILYQVLLKAFRFTYFSNLHSIFWGGVSIVEYLVHPCEKKRNETFTSDYGYTKGIFSPSECPHFWYRFFRHEPPYMTFDEVDPRVMQNLRRVFCALMSAAGRPLLIKNLYCSLRLGPISCYIPEAAFIIVERDIANNARSIIEARKKHFGDYKTWFSVKPPGYKKLLDLPPHQQVVEQIRTIYRLIDDELQAFPANRIIKLRYENLCARPKETVEQINNFFTRASVDIDMRPISLEPFSPQREICIDSQIYEKVCNYVKFTTT